MNYVVAGNRPWSRDAYRRRSPELPGTWHYVERAEDLSLNWLKTIEPRYVFFPHWSWKVPSDVIEAYECVCFHMTDVPFGRGGSPLQNLIVRGITHTKLSALRMVEEMDAGPVYMKLPLSLEGRAQEIFVRTADLVWDMIEVLIATNPLPEPQVGVPTHFKRRTPAEGAIPADGDLHRLFDVIRMLDAVTYPKAFLEAGNLRLEFDHAILDGDRVLARVVFTAKEALGK